MENTKKIEISIIILSWNTKDILDKCLESLFKDLKDSKILSEVIVIDNASSDNSSQLVEKKYPEVVLIKNKTNLGFAKGNNVGLKIAKGKYIMLLNSDTIVQKGTMEKLVGFYSSQKEKLVALSPLLLNIDGTPQEHYYMKFPNLWQIFGYHNFLIRPLIMRTPLKWTIVSKIKNQPVEVDQLPGASFVASKEVWEKVGLLSEDYRFLYEDVDWSWRAKKLGIKLFVIPEAKIIHLGGGSWKQKLNSQSFEFYRQFFSSLLLFVKKNYTSDKFQIFKTAIIINFLLQLKFKLAGYFLNNKNILTQNKLWE